MATIISTQLKRELKSQLHALKPVVIVGGNGVNENVLQEINRALDDHELIKIRLSLTDNAEFQTVMAEICKKTRSALIQSIGRIIAIYRKNSKT